MASRRLNIVLDLDTGGYSGRLTTAGNQMKTFAGTVDKTSGRVASLSKQFDSFSGGAGKFTTGLRDTVLTLGNLHQALIAVHAVAFGWVGALIKQSAEVERLSILMEGLSTATTDFGRKADAQKSLKALFDMARSNGVAVNELTQSFVKFKAVGLDPMNGSLQSLVDATARFGGNSEVMNRAAIAIQQMAGKGVVSMEELRQQLGEAVPTAMADMARGLGKSVAQFTAEVSKGKVQAKPALEAMFREFELLYAGSGDRMAQTLNGQIAQFKTNATELATFFTGMDTKGGLFETAANAMRELNQLMASSEGRVAVAQLGQSINGIATSLIGAIRWAVEWRDEIVAAGKAAITVFLAIKAVNIAAWFANMGFVALASLKNIGTATTPLGVSMDGLADRVTNLSDKYTRLESIRQIASTRASGDISASNQRAASYLQEADRLRTLQGDYKANLDILARQRQASEAALAAGRATGQFRDFETGQFISQNRALEINTNLIKTQTRNRALLRTTSAQLVATEAALTAETTVQAAAQGRLAAATTAQTVAQRAATVAMNVGAVAARGLAMAVNLILGPLGMVAVGLYAAAKAAGFFENRANKAAAAAARLRQGIADLDAMEQVKAQRDRLRAQKTNLESQLTEGVVEVNGEGVGMRRSISDAERKKIQAQIAAVDRSLGQSQADLDRGRQAINLDDGGKLAQGDLFQRNQVFSGLNRNYQDAVRRNASPKELERLRNNIGTAKNDYDTAYLAGQDKRIDQMKRSGVSKDEIAKAQAARDAYADATGKAETFAGAQAQVAESGGKAGTGTDKAASAAKKAATEYENAREKYGRMIADQAGNIAGLEDEIRGGEGALAKFNAQLKNGRFGDATKAELEKLAEGFRKLDELQFTLDFSNTFKRNAKDIAGAKAESDALWKSLKNGTWEADKGVAQINAHFAEQIEIFKKDALAVAILKVQMGQAIEQAQRASAAVAIVDMERQTEDINFDLNNDDGEARREAQYQRDVADMQRRLNLGALEGAERQRQELAFANWKIAMNAKLQRDNESGVVKMMRDWSKLGKNMNEVFASSIDGFVNSLEEGKFAFGDFVKSLVLGLLKVILRALIAYAIMSALGIGTGPGGSKQSLGEFMKGGISSGLGFGGGGGGGGAVATGGISVTRGGSIGMDSHHTGGWIGSGALKDGEVPIVGKAGEPVLSPAQATFYGKAFDAAIAGSAKPNVQVNVINNSGQQLTAEQGEPEINGRDMIISVVVDAANKQGPLRDSLQAMMQKNK